MRKILLFTLLCALIITGCVRLRTPKTALSVLTGVDDIESIRQGESILVLAPHPDDETIGCAGIIQRALAAGAEVRVVYLTNGDHNQAAFIVYEKRLTFRKGEFIHMGEVRSREAVKAMKQLGVNESKLVFLGYPDFGTFTILRDFWQTDKPFVSMLTRISQVPYKKNLSYGAPYTGENILADIKQVLKKYRPDKIFVSHPSDTNVDHIAFYLFLQVALCDLKGEIPVPRVYPYLVHCPRWPIPRYYHPDLVLAPPKQYPAGGDIRWLKSSLSSSELRNKHKAILCYKSQTESSAFYLLAFARRNELFGNYPEITLEPQKSSPDAKSGSPPVFSAKTGTAAHYETEALDYVSGEGENKIKVGYGYDGAYLYVRVKKNDDLNRHFSTAIYLFGYNYKTPFAAMPKICIMTKGDRFKVLGSRGALKPDGTELKFNSGGFLLKIPLTLLGEPDIVFTSLRAYGVKPRVSLVGFQKINIRRR